MLTAPRAAPALSAIALLFIGVALLTEVVGVLETYIAEDVGWTATNSLRDDLAQHCLGLDMAFHNALCWLVTSSARTRCGESRGQTPGHRVSARSDHAASWGW